MTLEPVWPKRPQGMQLGALGLITGQLRASGTCVLLNQVMLHPSMTQPQTSQSRSAIKQSQPPQTPVGGTRATF